MGNRERHQQQQQKLFRYTKAGRKTFASKTSSSSVCNELGESRRASVLPTTAMGQGTRGTQLWGAGPEWVSGTKVSASNKSSSKSYSNEKQIDYCVFHSASEVQKGAPRVHLILWKWLRKAWGTIEWERVSSRMSLPGEKVGKSLEPIKHEKLQASGSVRRGAVTTDTAKQQANRQTNERQEQ